MTQRSQQATVWIVRDLAEPRQFVAHVQEGPEDPGEIRGGPWGDVEAGIRWALEYSGGGIVVYGTHDQTQFAFGDRVDFPAWPPTEAERIEMDQEVEHLWRGGSDDSDGGQLGVAEPEIEP